ncbi:hypothetical protein L198_01374 [Cryptococcus wingfieldii CBS 7118]|uniref:Uncharacterized protein n=1 Tax=Cryptococcus wingfieldii CBS 7118 TaxID=1295528 RepID=A0A1E3K1R8_9TREE|nr:hypothetical protein L198_01374 [Cryptococcus wingfieldii CBS 7118]ODO06142.1 hypothetical protein L198_01374 [Cryptococcus wingfieldii CBS 7118]
MYYDLFSPFPIPAAQADQSATKKSKKAKGKAPAPTPSASPAPIKENLDCWEGLERQERDDVARRMAMIGHLGYSVTALTISIGEATNHVHPSPFQNKRPFPDLDPQSSNFSAPGSSNPGRTPLVQVARYHVRLDDGKAHCFTAANTQALRAYDILSVAPTTEKSFQLACTDLSNPGPNQISIITLPLHERPFTFRFNHKQMRQASRNGAVFELLYSAALFPPPSTPPDIARRYRQNFLSNAREVVRITGGKGIIFSSGPSSGNEASLRGCLDVVNLGTMIGMPANLAKEAVEKTPKMVLLRAQSRKTFKAIMTIPKYVPAPVEDTETESGKRPADVEGAGGESKKAKVST